MTSPAFGSARNCMRMRFRQKIITFTWLAILRCHLVCWCGEMKSPYKSYKGKKCSKKGKDQVTKWCMERLLKTWDQWNSQSFHGNSPLNLTRGVYSTPCEQPAARGQCADARWTMAYDHKTQSFMKKEISKSAWIKPWISIFKFQYYTMLKVDIMEEWDVVYSSPLPQIYTGYTY